MAQSLKKRLKNAFTRAKGVSKQDKAPEPEEVHIILEPLSATANAGEVTVWLDQFSTIINQISGLVKETQKGVSETRKGVVLAIFVTIATTITLSFEPSIGRVPVIAAIIVIAAIAVILILQWLR